MLSKTLFLVVISAISCSVTAFLRCGGEHLYMGECYNPMVDRRVCKRIAVTALCPHYGERCCVSFFKTPPITKPLCESIYKGKCLDFSHGDAQGCRRYIRRSEELCRDGKYCCTVFQSKPKPTYAPIVRPTDTNENCGIPDFPIRGDNDWRIVFGETSHKGSWPWQVSLLDMESRHFCGGSIIDNEWILTAAHCINWKNPRYVKVVVGQLTQHRYEKSRQIHRAEILILHPGFDRETRSASPNDIGLIKLRDPIRYDEHVKPICLPRHHKEGHFDGHQECWITGWGDTKGTANSAFLQQLKTEAWSNNDCIQHWGYGLMRSMICVGNMQQGACGGDSGGPMVCRENGKFYQVGLTSFGSKACQGAPSVYTRVTSFIPWINSVKRRY